MNKIKMKIKVMGTEYKVYIHGKEDRELDKNDGYIIPERKMIILDERNSPIHQQHVLRHELTHAFLYESGLDVESWANNEEIVDWIAIKVFDMAKTMKESVKNLRVKEKKNVRNQTSDVHDTH